MRVNYSKIKNKLLQIVALDQGEGRWMEWKVVWMVEG